MEHKFEILILRCKRTTAVKFMQDLIANLTNKGIPIVKRDTYGLCFETPHCQVRIVPKTYGNLAWKGMRVDAAFGFPEEEAISLTKGGESYERVMDAFDYICIKETRQ